MVYPSQTAFFVKGGQILDEFTAGTYTLKSENIPLLGKLINLLSLGCLGLMLGLALGSYFRVVAVGGLVILVVSVLSGLVLGARIPSTYIGGLCETIKERMKKAPELWEQYFALQRVKNLLSQGGSLSSPRPEPRGELETEADIEAKLAEIDRYFLETKRLRKRCHRRSRNFWMGCLLLLGLFTYWLYKYVFLG